MSELYRLIGSPDLVRVYGILCMDNSESRVYMLIKLTDVPEEYIDAGGKVVREFKGWEYLSPDLDLEALNEQYEAASKEHRMNAQKAMRSTGYVYVNIHRWRLQPFQPESNGEALRALPSIEEE